MSPHGAKPFIRFSMHHRSRSERLSVRSIGAGSRGNLGLPLVAVGEQLLLVVEELLAGLGGVLGVGG